jgi:hypothetical protein
MSADWWAKKLQGQVPQPRQDSSPPMPPSQQPMTPYVAPQPQPNLRIGSANQTLSCPECGSKNYMAVANAAPRCYDCGYPISQSGSRYGALTGANVEGPTKVANGNDVQSNWNPQGIIGRIDG